MSKGAKLSKRWSEAEARKMLAAVAKSGLSDRAFGLERGMDPQRLSWWRRRLGVKSGKTKRASAAKFVELVSRPSTTCTIEIELANRRRVVVPSTIDAVVLARVLDVVEGRRC